MQKKCLFITGSQYEGTFRAATNSMDGFGRYTFPDGSEYLGFFRNSQFHGYGRFRLAPPYNFTYKGEFNNGRLVAIEDMNFSDGLRFKATIDEDKVDASQWRYCSPSDRRYASELYWGIEPVGPSAFVSKWRRPRNMEPRYYDLEEGVYGSSTGFVSMRPLPLTPLRFVGCPKEREWILKNCRRADSKPIREPDPEIGRRIIETNLGLRKASPATMQKPHDKPKAFGSESARTHGHECDGLGGPSAHLLELVDSSDESDYSSGSYGQTKEAPRPTSRADREECEGMSVTTPSSDRMRTPSTHSKTSFSEASLQLPQDELVNCVHEGFDRLQSYEMDMRTSVLTTYRESAEKRTEMLLTGLANKCTVTRHGHV